MPPISFNQVPNNIRVPFVYVEIDNSRAVQGPSIQEYKVLVIGQRLSSGTKPNLSLERITSADQAKQYYGNGSMLAHQLEKLLDNNQVTQVFALAVDDNGGGVKSSGKFAFTGPATAAGTLSVMIGGRRVQVAVDSGDVADDIASALNTALQGEADLAVDSVINGSNANEVDVTAKNAGEAGDEIDLRINYFSGEELPEGVGVTITAMNGGTANPDISTALATLDDTQYNIIANPYSDAANLLALESELSDRFGPLTQNDGVAIGAKRDDFSGLTTLGNSRNSQHSSIMGMAGPMSPWEWSAGLAGILALAGQADPARPFQTLEIDGILAPSASELFTLTERNQLLQNGIATYNVDDGGVVRIERMITTYQTNQFGATDTSFLDVNTLLTLSYLRFDFRNTFLRKFPRHKLASDGARIAPGQPILTPKSAKAEAIAIFRGWEELGLVEGADQFKRDLIVERNIQDPNRLDFLLPPDLVNQLRVSGVQIQFLL